MCEDHAEFVSDEQAMLASTLADEDDDCWMLASKIVGQLTLVSAAEVTDEITGNGVIVHESESIPDFPLLKGEN